MGKIAVGYKILLLALLLIAINIFIYVFDYTKIPYHIKTYQLDEASYKQINKIKEPIIITVYCSESLNLEERQFMDRFASILAAYKKNLKGASMNIIYINPDNRIGIELEANNLGILALERREKNSNITRRIFMGMVIQVGNKTEVIPSIRTNRSIEYILSSSLRKLASNDIPRIGLVSIDAKDIKIKNISKVLNILKPKYEVLPVQLKESEMLHSYSSLLIIGPRFKFSDIALKKLDDFLAQGKNIIIALDRVDYSWEESKGYQIDTNLETWLEQKGAIVNNDFIVDKTCGHMRIEESNTDIMFHYFPKINNFSENLISQGISDILMLYPSSITPVNKSGVKFTALAKTSKLSGKKLLPMRIDFKHEWKLSDYLNPEEVVVALLEGKWGNQKDNKAKILLLSDADIAKGDNIMFTNNYNYLANAIDWLSDRDNLFELNKKHFINRKKKILVKVGIFQQHILGLLAPIILVAIIAFYCFYRRKKMNNNLKKIDL